MTELPNRLLRDALDEAASAPSAACLDAPTLAAWMDGTLTRAERATVETHAAGCTRCLALVAAMARTEPPAPERRRWRFPLVWVPLATLAAALIVVRLVLVERQPPPATVESIAAANRPSPPAGAPIVAPPVARAETSVPEQPKRKRAAAPVSPAPPAIAPPPTTAPSAIAPPPTTAPSTTAPLTATASAAATQSVPAAAPVPTAVAAATPAPAPPRQLLRDEVTVAKTDATGVAARMQKTAAPAPVVIRSPDPDSQWRIVGGMIEHTADGGATWQAQPVGVPAQMRAGAAPDARVCWMVGAGGVVLRTTDGATWTRVAFPAADDLVAVQASDASRATVTTAAGLRFATGDGGATWAPQ
jgi:Photosynthesis system II assembly factor YCF48/Putative zinc-finger